MPFQIVSTYFDHLMSHAGHVIPPDHLLPLCLTKGPSGAPFDFTYQQRGSPAQMEDLGRAILNLSSVVAAGVVCFFPSYDYERRVHSHWSSSGLLEKISRKKTVFREPKMASHVESVLGQYGRCIEKKGGALMLCVVGGKLSEGINFSDDLGRCVRSECVCVCVCV